MYERKRLLIQRSQNAYLCLLKKKVFEPFLKTLTGSVDAISVLIWMQYNTVKSFKFVGANFHGLSILLRFVAVLFCGIGVIYCEKKDCMRLTFLLGCRIAKS